MATSFGKLNFAVSFNPQTAFPLDARSYFESYEKAKSAALSAGEAGSTDTVYYYGQTVVVNEANLATLYIIQPDKTLKEVGSVPVGDGKTIEVVDGKIILKGFGQGYYKYNSEVEGHYEFVEGEFISGLQPQVVASKEGTGFEIAWFEPNPTTVEGLETQISSLSSSVNNLTTKTDSIEIIASQNKSDISALMGRMSDVENNKANKSDLESVVADLNTLTTTTLPEIQNDLTEAIKTVEDGILVKSVNNEQLEVTEQGELQVKAVSTDLLVQGTMELIFDGGAAE